MRAAHALTAKSAIRAQNKAFGFNIFERFTDERGDVFGPLDLQAPVVDDANTNFFVFAHQPPDDFEVQAIIFGGLERQHVDIELIKVW